MPASPLSEFMQQVRQTIPSGNAHDAPDEELLERFAAHAEEAAFESLVVRHGPMVLGVCRRYLHRQQDIEDAFQATFLVLVRRAHGLRQPHLLANWLYGVAYRVAVRARAQVLRSPRTMTEQHDLAEAQAKEPALGADEQPLLLEEVHRLPHKYRVPVILCYLQGKSNEEAAQQLCWPVGSVKGRLSRARQMLRARLLRRGISLSLAAVSTELACTTTSAAVSATFQSSCVQACLSTLSGQPTSACFATAQAVALSQGVLHTMVWTRFLWVGFFFTVAVLSGGTGMALQSMQVQERSPATKASTAREALILRTTPELRARVDEPTEAEAIKLSMNNLKVLGLGMHGYHDTNNSFPPAAVYSNGGKPLLSWRVLLLPHLDENELFKQFKLDEPWDGPNNKKLLDKMPKVYAALRGKERGKSNTHYQVITGKNTMFDGPKPIKIQQILDGTSNTILIAEAASAVPWTKPEDLVVEADKPLPKMGGLYENSFLVVLADGAAISLKTKIKEKTLRALITPAGGEVVNIDD